MPGRLLAVAVLLGSGTAGLAYTEDPARVWDAVGNAGGFGLRQMTLEGQEQTSDSAIVAAIGLGPGVTLLGLDVDAARTRLESLPWVDRAVVRKALPGRLDIAIEEAEAFARWRTGGREVLVGRSGMVLADEVPRPFRALPLVAGAGANEAAGGLRVALDRRPALDARVLAAVRVNDRRWDLLLASGSRALLPAEEVGAALDRLEGLERDGGISNLEGAAIDLRLPNRTTVALKSAAPAATPKRLVPDAGQGDVADPLAAAIAEATAAHDDDPLGRAISEAFIP